MMTTPDILPVIQRKNPEREFEILKQIGSGTYGEVFKVDIHTRICYLPARMLKAIYHVHKTYIYSMPMCTCTYVVVARL